MNFHANYNPQTQKVEAMVLASIKDYLIPGNRYKLQYRPNKIVGVGDDARCIQPELKSYEAILVRWIPYGKSDAILYFENMERGIFLSHITDLN